MCAEALVSDNEIASTVMRACRGLEVNNGNLAVDVIREVGLGCIFSGQKYTLKHYKTEIWMPEISDKNTYATWQKMGSMSMDKVAKERVRAILATHKPKPIPEDVEKEICQIVQRAEAEVLRKS